MSELTVGRLRSDAVRRVIKRACQFNIPRQERFDLCQGGRLRQLCEDEHLEIRGPDDAKKEAGWVFEPDRQRALLKEFWGRLEKKQSLVFFYCNEGNPLDENLSRILVGLGRISNVGSQHYFGKKPPTFDDDYPIWSRCVTHDFENQGFRLPYHEYLREGHDLRARAASAADSCRADRWIQRVLCSNQASRREAFVLTAGHPTPTVRSGDPVSKASLYGTKPRYAPGFSQS